MLSPTLRFSRKCFHCLVHGPYCIFDSHDVLLRIYFPPVQETAKTESPKLSKADAEDVRAAEEVASKLPDVPKSEPGDSEHPEKKQKQNQ